MKKLTLSCIVIMMLLFSAFKAEAVYDMSLAPPGYVLIQCDWNPYAQWFMKVYYWSAANHYTYRFHFFCERLGTNARDDDAGVDGPGNQDSGYDANSNDQYGSGDPGAQATADENFGGSDIGDEGDTEEL